MVMKFDRIDFVEESKCYFCNRPLSTKAYIFISDNGSEIQAGPNCAKKNMPISDNILDFTKGSIDILPKTAIENNKNNILNTHHKNNENIEIIYLRLRCEKLKDFKNIEYEAITNIYNKYKLGNIEENDIKHLRNIIRKSENNKWCWTYKNLMACYSAKHALNSWIKKERNDFAKNIYRFLKDNYYLTENQIIAANNQIKNIGELSKINGKWFWRK